LTGYIKAFKPEMKIRDYEVYKGIYCSLCKQLGKSYTPFAQLLLNYDYVFMIVLRMSLSNDCPVFKKSRCQYNPFLKCNCCKNNDILSETADLIVLISYHKMKDNIRDSRGVKKLIAWLLYPALAIMHIKAKKRLPEYEGIISEAMKEQNTIESNNEKSIDIAAEPTSRALSKIFTTYEDDEQQKTILLRLGYLLGRWVYIIDAVDDLRNDIKINSFNVFSSLFQEDPTMKEAAEFASYARQVLSTTAGEAVLAFELLETKRFKGILENLMYDGLTNSAQAVIKKYDGGCDVEKPI
jgi:hypothetical protein